MDPYDEIHRWEIEQEMRCRIGTAFGHRNYPRVRGRWRVVCRPLDYRVLDTKRTRRAAFRRARELRTFAKRGAKPTILVYPLPKIRGRRTVDWAVAVRAQYKTGAV